MALNDDQFNKLYLLCCDLVDELAALLKDSFSEVEIALCIAEMMKLGILEADFKAYIAPIIKKMLQQRTPDEVCGVDRRLALLYSLSSGRPTQSTLNDGVKTSVISELPPTASGKMRPANSKKKRNSTQLSPGGN